MPALIIINEGIPREAFPLHRATMMIGRDPDSGILLESTAVSSNHASIIFENGDFVVHDNGSTNGTFVNGDPVTVCHLKHQDIIRFGPYVFLVDLEDKSSGVETPPAKAVSVDHRDRKYDSSRILSFPSPPSPNPPINRPPVYGPLIIHEPIQIVTSGRFVPTPKPRLQSTHEFMQNALFLCLGAGLVALVFYIFPDLLPALGEFFGKLRHIIVSWDTYVPQ